MKARCYNAAHQSYQHYGERGIDICKEWLNDFDAFRQWASVSGYLDNLTIDRKDNDIGYEPSNCRWVPHAAQSNNRRCNRLLTHDGKTQSIADWSRETGLHQATIYYRISNGWNHSSAVTTPPRR